MKLRNLLLSICFILLCTSTVFGVAADMYVTSGGAGTKSGADWANAFSIAEFETDVEVSAEAGDAYYVTGTQTFTQSIISALDGSAIAPIKVIGVKASTTNEPPVFSDYAFDADRPVFAQGAYVFQPDFSWFLENIIITSTASDAVLFDDDANFRNNKCTQSSGTADRLCISGSDDTIYFDNEIISTNGYGIRGGARQKIISNYFHDLKRGIRFEGGQNDIVMNIFDTCSTDGILMNSLDRNLIAYNTFYGANAGDAINTLTNNPNQNVIIGNIFQDWASGLNWNSTSNRNFLDYNSYFSNTNDVVNIIKGNNSIDATDAGFTDAAGGDFSIGTNLKAASFPGEFPGALSTGYLDIGAVQRVEAAASGTNATGAISVGF